MHSASSLSPFVVGAGTLGVVGYAGGLLLGALALAALAVTARRLLGVRVGLVRTVVAGAVGYVVAALVSAAIATPGAHKSTPLLFLPVLIGVAVLVAMAVLGLAEALVPSGSRLRPLRAARRRIQRTRRYSQISSIAVRHGLGPYLHGRRRASVAAPHGRAGMARSLRLALEEGGVTFVKLGQLLSTRPDLVSAEIIAELNNLQNQVAPARWEEVEQLLVEELGAPPSAKFAEFVPEPLAAGSIAQVHRARLHSGADVVVKIQRPGIRPFVERDLDILRAIARTIDSRTRRGTNVLGTIHTATARGVNVLELADGFAAAITEELDFRVEARNMAAVSAASPGRDDHGDVRVPRVYAEWCTERVLVLERLAGVPLGIAGERLEERHVDRTALAHALLEYLLRQITLEGIFHADPHPGNILLLDDGRLGLLDFGSVGRLDVLLRAALAHLLLAIAMFRSWAEEGADPLLTEAEFLHVEEHEDHAVVLLRRRMRAEESSSLYELRLRNHDGVWRVSGETITPWITDDPLLNSLRSQSSRPSVPLEDPWVLTVIATPAEIEGLSEPSAVRG